jgi:hypothetical protein
LVKFGSAAAIIVLVVCADFFIALVAHAFDRQGDEEHQPTRHKPRSHFILLY